MGGGEEGGTRHNLSIGCADRHASGLIPERRHNSAQSPGGDGTVVKRANEDHGINQPHLCLSNLFLPPSR